MFGPCHANRKRVTVALAESSLLSIGEEPMPPAVGQAGDGGEFAGALFLCAACLPEETEVAEGAREQDGQAGEATALLHFPFAPGTDAGPASALIVNEPQETAATEEAAGTDAARALVRPECECGYAAARETAPDQPAPPPPARSRRPDAVERFESVVKAGPDDDAGPDVQSGPELTELAVEASGGSEAPAGEEPVTGIPPARETQQRAAAEKTSTEEVQTRALVPAVRLSRAGQSRAPVAFAVQLPEGQAEAPCEREAGGRRTTRIAAGLLSQAERYAAPRTGAGPSRREQPLELAALNRVPVAAQRPGSPEATPQAGSADGPLQHADAPPVKQTAQPVEAVRALPVAAETGSVQACPRVEPQVVAVIEPRHDGARPEAIPAAPKSWEGVRVQVPPAQTEELLEASGTVRTLRLNVEAAPGRPVSLLFTAEAGAVRVLARSADPAMAEALRTNIESLREAGFEALGSEGAAGKGPDRAARSSDGSNESGHGEGGRRHPAEYGDAGSERTNRNLDRWLEALDRQANARSAPVEGEDEV